MILIDPAVWPAHGTVFAHLVSDSSLAELHAFAASNGLPQRAFDHDHYDVPQRRVADLVAAGAVPVASTELMRRLVASGLRVRTRDRTPKAAAVLPGLRDRWAGLLPDAPELGDDLLARWQEPHRRYHDVRHLAHVLECLDLLCEAAVPRAVELAAWFHDAVHDGVTPADEEASARLASGLLRAAGVPAREVDEVARLILLTVSHAPAPGDVSGALLVDADLAVLALPEARYHVYVRDVRAEYEHVPDGAFRAGRVDVLRRLSAASPLYRTPRARALWEASARRNLAAELAGLGARIGE